MKRAKPAFSFSFRLSVPVDEICKWDSSKMAAFFSGLANLMAIRNEQPTGPRAKRGGKKA